MRIATSSILFCLAIASIAAAQTPRLQWQIQESGSDASLRGLFVVDEEIAWASGSGGTVLRTIDGGHKWEDVSVKTATDHDFRDLHAFDENSAVVINAGQPAVFYRTRDGGKTWAKVFRHDNQDAFFDAVAAITPDHLIAMSDPIDDRVLLVESLDRGQTWSELPRDRRPKKDVGEAGFAASGSNMIVARDSGHLYLAMGSHSEGQEASTSRLLVSRDRAKTWKAINVPIKRNPSSGIFSLTSLPQRQFDGAIDLDGDVLIAVGGNYKEPTDGASNIAIVLAGNQTKFAPVKNRPRGFRSCVAHTLVDGKSVLIAVGPNGTDVSFNQGTDWTAISDEAFHAVKTTRETTSVVWASGANGRIGKLFSE